MTPWTSSVCQPAAFIPEPYAFSSKLDLYNHFPLLVPAAFRLLWVKPGDPEDPLICELRLASLDDYECPNYVAISYTWGEVVFDASIPLHGFKFTITSHLHAALVRFRRCRRELFWVDQICINQDDVNERSQQVLMMRRIYSQTLMVFVWLGDSNRDIVKGFELAKHLQATAVKLSTYINSRYSKDNPTGIFGIDVIWQSIRSEEAAEHLEALGEGPAGDDDSWEAYYDLFCKPWFRRTWVLQEVAVRKLAYCWAFCGDNNATISLANLYRSVQAMGLLEMILKNVNPAQITNAHRIRIPNLECPESSGMYCLTQMGDLADGEESYKQELVFMLDRLRYCSCSDPRDRIFGLLGIDPHGSRYPAPDYSLSVEKVFYLFGWYMIAAERGVEVLCRAGKSRQRLWLPSWCPDWTTPSEFNIRNLSSKVEPGVFNTWPQFGNLLIAYFSITMGGILSKWSLGRVHLDQTKRVVYAYGCMFDSIARLGPVPQVFIDAGGKLLWKDRSTWLMQSFEVMQRSGCAGSDMARYKALMRLLMFSNALKTIPEPTTKQFRAAFGVSPEGILGDLAAQHDLEYGTLEEAITNNPVLNAREDRLSNDFQSVVSQVIRERRLCVTKRGYIGLVPAMTEISDDVYQFQDAVTPSILRKAPNPSHFELIGEAYMLDLMDGIPWTSKQYLPGYIMIV